MRPNVFVVGFVATLLLLAASDSVLTDMFPGEALTINEVQETAQVYQGEIYRHRFEDLNFEFSGEVYDRDGSLDSGVNEDFQRNSIRNTDTYTKSSLCDITHTQIVFDKQMELPELNEKITAYLYDSQYGIFFLAGKYLQYYAVGTLEQDIKLQKLADTYMPKEFSEEDAEMFSADSNNYIADGDKLFRITTDNKDGKLQLTLHDVAGYNSLPEDSELVKVIRHDDNTVHVLGTASIETYTVKGDSVTSKDFFGKFFSSSSTFVDIDKEGDRIYILDRLNGLYVFDANNPTKYKRFDLNYGSNLKLQTYADTVEIICEYKKVTFVAELIWSGDSLYLNRFYDQISGFKDIDFYDDKALFIGEDEIMVLSHSVNRNYLRSLKRQHMRSYAAYGLINFEILRPYSKNSSSLVVFGVAAYTVVVAKVRQDPAELFCDFTGVGTGLKTFVVEFNTTHCGSGDWRAYHKNSAGKDSYCRIRRAFNIQVKRPYERKVSNLFSTSLFLIVIIGILLIIGAAAKWKVNMNSLLARLRNQLRKKQTPNKGSTADVLHRI